MNDSQRQNYANLLKEKSLQIGNLFTGSAYWDNEHEGMLYAMDWIPQSGSIKLLEMNTNIGLSGRMKPYFDFSELVSHITSSGHTTCTYYEDYLNFNIEPQRVEDTLDIFKQHLSSSLSSSGCTFTHEYNLWDEVIPTPSSTHYVLRQGHLNYHNVDVLCENKTTFRNFITGSLGEDFFPAFGSNISSSFSNPTNIPDVVIKDPTEDMGVGVSFTDFTEDRNQIYNNHNYVEQYIEPEIDNSRYRLFRSIILIGSGSVKYLIKNPTYTINYRKFGQPSGSVTIGSQNTNIYDYNNVRIWQTGHFEGNTPVSMSDGSVKTIGSINSGEVVKSVILDNYPKRNNSFISSTTNVSWPQYILDKGNWTGSIGELSESTSSVNSVPQVYSWGYYELNGSTKVNPEDSIMVYDNSKYKFKPMRDIQVNDVFVTKGFVTQSVSSINLVTSESIFYSLDLETEDRYLAGDDTNSVITSDSYW
tara:strand:+ start:2610 stop:4031 length:1422 start_codon:yes stop_codon:yes gene_type:complete